MGVADASSGGIGAAFLSFGLVGSPGISMTPGIAHPVLHAECVAHGARHDLQLHLVLGRERHQHHEERDQETHEIREGHEPAVAAAVCRASFLRHQSESVRYSAVEND